MSISNTDLLSDLLTAEQLKLQEIRESFKSKNLLNKDDSAPFHLWPHNSKENFDGKKAVILIHGFLGTPYFMRSLAKIYASHGYYCYAPTLLGHGACPEAMRCYSLEDILNALNKTIDKISEQVEEIHLCGFSLGGLLSLLISKQRSRNPQKKPISSLTLFAPALGITPLAKLIPILTQFGLGNIHNPSAAKLNGLHNPAMYAWHPWCAVLPILKGIHEAELNPEIWDDLPIFLIASTSDNVVKLAPILNLFKRNQNKNSRLRLYGPENFSPLTPKIDLIKENSLGKNIKNLSHICLVTPPSDELLGVDSPQYKNLPKDILLGEKLSDPILDQFFRKKLLRLFYNPDFDGLTHSLSEFLNKIK